jgi:hypothetical protein
MEKLGVEYVHPVTYIEGSQKSSEGEEVTWTDAEETALRRKLDYRIVPLVTLLYLLCFVRLSPLDSPHLH